MKGKVMTPHGIGTIVKPEGTEGILKERFLVKLDFPKGSRKEMQDEQGGLYYFKDELKQITNTINDQT